ncbi:MULTISPECIES: 23S rRNA (uracil(747)-C(5))-methyltransferase RlmC [unclassified Actinotalea]|uniref:23S rRNA (uracil(747)-C(5))-methyltransferase RlmC n=1 Tax=unclassified Actinotalea TaxID=2638618 RepID=UPI0015F4D19C|nr:MULTISPECIES: 23S rRNA (uracil(747)-C(5))-methyltransferase RlmC [unclassified Actinotalea]
MRCDYHDTTLCRSCTLLDRSYEDQLAGKEAHCRRLLAPYVGTGTAWLPPARSPEQGFRNKAKMVVGATADEPTVGILDAAGRGVDLRECGLHTAGIRAALPHLAAFVTLAGLVPYDIAARRGELKHVLVTESPDGELMVRFVLRSQEPVARLRKHLPALLSVVPALRVASVNLQPEHKAVLEGEREILLTPESALTMRLDVAGGGVPLHVRPQSFFQTNTPVAAAVYGQARAWVTELDPRTMWDLYCGVGGFALHCADGTRDVVGIETSVEAVASARLSRDEAGLAGVRFEAGDATAFALSARDVPDLVVVNPPRRGVGPDLAGWLEASGVAHVLYSSCNAVTLAKDLEAMPSLRPQRVRLLDMFPQTSHYEVMTLLARR